MLAMKLDRSSKLGICLAFLASLPLALWSYLLSARIAHGGVLQSRLDSLSPGLRVAGVVLTVLALACTVFIVVRAVCSGATKPGHVIVICVSWVLGTFALHCWVLYELAGGMPAWASAKRDSEEMTMVLNSGLTGYAGTQEDRARARDAMQMQMPGRGVTVPSVEQKLALALKFEENQHLYLKSIAAVADSAERGTARRGWISWATTAFTPVILLALFAARVTRSSSAAT